MIVDSRCSQCVCVNGFSAEKLHGHKIETGIALARTEIIEPENFDLCTKTCIQDKTCMLLIKNGLNAT